MESEEITPALAPPQGVTPDFRNPYSILPLVQITLVICIGVSSLFVILRLYTRLLIVRAHGWEDCELEPE